MTSTHFNIGLTAERNSSRVLRPPGGGHSDIFGINDNEIAMTPNKRRNYSQSQSTIGSCFTMRDSEPESNLNGNVEKIIENGNENNLETEVDCEKNVTDENRAPGGIPQVQQPDKKEEKAPAKSGRVPPGGYSTAFW